MQFEEIPIDRRIAKRRQPMAGWGNNDAPHMTQCTQEGKAKRCPYWSVWSRMVWSVYGANGSGSICEEWRNFMTFRKWVEAQTWGGGRRFDVVLLGDDDRHHSPETCCFLTREAAGIMPSLTSHRGDYRVGVDEPLPGKFRGTCGGKHLGYFKTEAEAHAAWREKKAADVYRVAHEHVHNMKVYHTLMRVYTDLTDHV